MTYTTKSGDMWDQISYALYGTSAYMAKLLYANPDYAKMFILPAGIELDVPELERQDVDRSFIPPWRR